MRTITVKNRIGRYDDASPFVVGSDDLELRINHLCGINGKVVVVVKSGDKRLTLDMHGGAVVIPNSFLQGTSGELTLNVARYIDGQCADEIVVEPLRIKQAEMTLTLDPVIAALEQAIEEGKKRVKTLEETLTQQAQTLAEIKSQIMLIKGGYDPLKV